MDGLQKHKHLYSDFFAEEVSDPCSRAFWSFKLDTYKKSLIYYGGLKKFFFFFNIALLFENLEKASSKKEASLFINTPCTQFWEVLAFFPSGLRNCINVKDWQKFLDIPFTGQTSMPFSLLFDQWILKINK